MWGHELGCSINRSIIWSEWIKFKCLSSRYHWSFLRHLNSCHKFFIYFIVLLGQMGVLFNGPPEPEACLSSKTWDICTELTLIVVARRDRYLNLGSHHCHLSAILLSYLAVPYIMRITCHTPYFLFCRRQPYMVPLWRFTNQSVWSVFSVQTSILCWHLCHFWLPLLFALTVWWLCPARSTHSQH